MNDQLGARIAKLRRACGMTQETLGNRLGVSAAAVSKWETGAACPDVTLLCPLARALHTNVNALLAFEQTMTREQLTAFSEAFVQLVRGGRRQTALDDMERQMIERAMTDCGGNMSAVAARLGISRQTLYNKIKRYGL